MKSRTASAVVQLGHIARLVSHLQPHRTHVLGTVIVNSEITLVVYDRSGAVVSQTYQMDEHPYNFLIILLGFMYANDAEMGFDPTIRLNDDMMTGEMRLDDSDLWFPITEVLHVEGTLVGRGTICFKICNVKSDEEWDEGIVKDCWTESDETRQESEAEILEKIKGVKGVPKVFSYWTVEDSATGVHTSARFRLGVVEETTDGDAENQRPTYKWKIKNKNKIMIRVQCRMLIVPVGKPIQHFSSLVVLLAVLQDIVLSTSPRKYLIVHH